MSGSKDMTTRIWDIDTGVEVAKFMSSSGGEWIIVTPDGYYNTSPEGASLLHWVYPGGLETFTFEQFESRRTSSRLDFPGILKQVSQLRP
jgi:hypothetical protein